MKMKRESSTAKFVRIVADHCGGHGPTWIAIAQPE
jgi:hypothetical protein